MLVSESGVELYVPVNEDLFWKRSSSSAAAARCFVESLEHDNSIIGQVTSSHFF